MIRLLSFTKILSVTNIFILRYFEPDYYDDLEVKGRIRSKLDVDIGDYIDIKPKLNKG